MIWANEAAFASRYEVKGTMHFLQICATRELLSYLEIQPYEFQDPWGPFFAMVREEMSN